MGGRREEWRERGREVSMEERDTRGGRGNIGEKEGILRRKETGGEK